MDSELVDCIIQDSEIWQVPGSSEKWSVKAAGCCFNGDSITKFSLTKFPSYPITLFGGPGDYVPLKIFVVDYKITKLDFHPTEKREDCITIKFFDTYIEYYSIHMQDKFIVYTVHGLYDHIKSCFYSSNNVGRVIEPFFEEIPHFSSIQYTLDKMTVKKQDEIIEIEI